GRRIVRLPDDMARHDAAMVRFSQWWRRGVRAGHSYAEGFDMHGRSPERHYSKEVRSILAWGAILPIVSLSLACLTRGTSLLLLGSYAVLWLKVYRGRRRQGDLPAGARVYALFTVLGKFAGLLGVWKFFWNRKVLGRGPQIIEYKTAASA